MNELGVILKAIFLFSGLIILPLGLIIDSMVRVIGGLGLIFLALIINGK